MEACIVCDVKLSPQDKQDVTDKINLHKRLTKVLDTTELPSEPSVCPPCQFDLSQIEVYYKLLDIFRQRFWQTVARRRGSLMTEGKSVENVLEKTSAGYSRDLQIILGPSYDETTDITNCQNENDIGEDPEIKSKKSGNDNVSLKHAEHVLHEGNDNGLNNKTPTKRKRGRPRKEPPQASTKGGKKRGRPKKNDSLVMHQRKKVGVVSSTENQDYDAETDIEANDEQDDNGDGYDNAGDSEHNSGSCIPSTNVRKTRHSESTTSKPRGRQKQPPLTRQITCEVCDKIFDTKAKYKIHIKIHNEERPAVCDLCGKAFKSKGALNAHIKLHTTEKKFECDVCHKKFLSQKLLVRHSVRHTDVKPFSCDKCGRGFKTKQYLTIHDKHHHVQGRRFLCTTCGVGFFTQTSLDLHMETHKDVRQKPFKCDVCGKDFHLKSTLKEHQTIHTEEDRRKFLCPICGKAVISASYLKYHVQKHTGEAKFLCTVCNKRFPAKGILTRHMMIHTGETPYKCSVCGKGCRSTSNLRLHKMTHTEERPFKCGCGASFRQKSKLERHWKTKKHVGLSAEIEHHEQQQPHELNMQQEHQEEHQHHNQQHHNQHQHQQITRQEIQHPKLQPVLSPPSLPPCPPPLLPPQPAPMQSEDNMPQMQLDDTSHVTVPAKVYGNVDGSSIAATQYQIDPLYLGLYHQPPMN